MSLYYTDLIDVLQAAGVACQVSSVNAGWETRSRSSGGFPKAPLCVFWHHTASATSPANDLSYMVHGSPDAPVGNMLLDRDGIVWPVAAGASNCAGKGGPSAFSRGTIPVDSGNTYGWQIEAANNGVGEAWPQAQIDAYFKASNALNARFGNQPTDVIGHAHYTSRKIDPATAWAVQGPWVPGSINSSGTWSIDDLRAECANRAGAVTPSPPDPNPNPNPDPNPDPITPIEEDDDDMATFLIRNSATGQIGLLVPGMAFTALSGDEIDAYEAKFGTWLETSDGVFTDFVNQARA